MTSEETPSPIRYVNLSEVQGNILKGFNKPNLRLLFFKFGDNVDKTREWLESIEKRIPSTFDLIQASKRLREERLKNPFYRPQDTWMHVSLSKSGVEALNLPYPPASHVYKGLGKKSPIEKPDPFLKDAYDPRRTYDPFYKGMKSRAEILGDEGKSAPEAWDEPYRSGKIDALLIVAADEEDDLGIATSQIIAEATYKELSCIGVEIGKSLENEQGKQVEHFGFRDGISQPLIRGVDKETIRKRGKKDVRYNNKDVFDPEDFVLFGLEGPLEWVNDGSFLVFRKLEQNVGGFWEFMKSAYDDDVIKIVPEELAAKLVGRWKSGAPLAQHDKYDPVAPDYSEENDFMYMKNSKKAPVVVPDDPNGEKTLFFAHTRWANPRDWLPNSKQPPARNRIANAQHRILRRGIPYGPPWARDKERNTSDPRGLLFICYQRDISEQYQYIQNQLISNPPYLPATGPHIDIMRLMEPKGYSKPGLENWVTTKGGAYFFSPSKHALRYLKQYAIR